jgi:Pentapeptide repeats (8 copies)
MGIRLRLLWQKVKQYQAIILVTGSILMILIVLIVIGYRVSGTGFAGKTLWDWLQLLIIPVVLAIAGSIINVTVSRGDQQATKQRAETEREIAKDNQHEASLQIYIDKMSEILLEKHLRKSDKEDEVRKIARVRTLTVLPRLDALRKESLLQFLYESGLIENANPIIDLSEANLSGANLSGAFLFEADLSGANLSGACLFEADLSESDLSKANLMNANLRYANLRYADLSGATLMDANLSDANLSHADLSGATLMNADLSHADLSHADLSNSMLDGTFTDADNWDKTEVRQLEKAQSLKGAIMPDGSKHS